MSVKINFFNISGKKFLPYKKIENCLLNAFRGERIRKANVTLIFADDSYILRLNNEYLKHDYLTDVISFLLEEDSIEGEVYISVDRAIDQAKEYNVSLTNELIRLAVHGTLHLLGYDDGSEEERSKMAVLENKYMTR